MKKVSIIIATYNHEKYIKEAIDSALLQNYPNIEIIVVNDGSTDGTKEVLESYKDKIVILNQSNLGQAAARNNGIKKSTGEYLCYLDSDDIYLPGKISKQVEVLNNYKDIGLVHTGLNYVDEKGRYLQTVETPEFNSRKEQIVPLINRNFIAGGTVMVRKELLDSVGYFNERYSYAEDYDLWLRLLHLCNFKLIAEPLYHYRRHSTNITEIGKNRDMVKEIRANATNRFYEKGEISNSDLSKIANRLGLTINSNVGNWVTV